MQVKVKNVRFVTNKIGILTPIASLTKMAKLEVPKKDGESKTQLAEFDALVLSSSAFVDKNKIGSGSILEIEMTDKGVNVKEVVSVSEGAVFPSKCPSCREEIFKSGDHLVCMNNFCSAKTRTTIYRLIHDVAQFTSLETITTYLNSFPLKEGGTTHVGDLVTFLQLFGTSGAKDTASRAELIMKNFNPEMAASVMELETALENKFKKGISSMEFWHILSIPHTPIHFFRSIDARKLAFTKIQKSGLPSAIKKSVYENRKKISILLRIIDSMKKA